MTRAALALAVLLTDGCQQPVNPPAQAAKDEPTQDAVFRFLTANRWRTNRPGISEKPGQPDFHVIMFSPDGRWSSRHVTDYDVPPRTGRWNLQPDQAGNWLVCRDNGQRQQVIMNADGTLTLTAMRLYPDEPIPANPRFSASTLPVFKLPAEVEEIVRRLTAHPWQRANDLDLRMEPTDVQFKRDWTYTAIYRNGQCISRGHWYATVDEISAINLAGKCDDRPGAGGDWLTVEVIDDSKILVNHDLYVPESDLPNRGIIWRLFGYDAVAITIEYDMPVTAGKPIRFDVTMTNQSHAPVKLERFSLTEAFDNYGRDAGNTGQELILPQELAAVDLNRMELAPGQSRQASLGATFTAAGPHWIYFNALISGATNNWDYHQAHEMSIRE